MLEIAPTLFGMVAHSHRPTLNPTAPLRSTGHDMARDGQARAQVFPAVLQIRGCPERELNGLYMQSGVQLHGGPVFRQLCPAASAQEEAARLWEEQDRGGWLYRAEDGQVPDEWLLARSTAEVQQSRMRYRSVGRGIRGPHDARAWQAAKYSMFGSRLVGWAPSPSMQVHEASKKVQAGLHVT